MYSYNHGFAHVPQNEPVKECRKSVIGEDIDKSWRLTFLAHPVHSHVRSR